MPVLFSQRQHIARLGEIGRFETAETDRDEPVRVNALPAVSLAAAFHNDAHTFASGKEIRRIMDQFSSTLPHGMEVHLIHFSPDEVQQKLYQKGHLLVQVLALSLIVLVLFVRSCQGGVLAVSLGMTGLLSFLAMRVMGITATPNGLLGMGLAVGFVIPVFYWVQNSFRLDSAGVLSSLKTVEQQNDSSLLQRHWQKWGGSWIATSAVMAGMVSALILLLEQSWAQGLVVIRTVSLMSVISVLLSLTLTPLLMYWVYRAGRLHCFPAPNLLWRLYARSITGMARFRFFLVCAFLALLLVAIKIGMALPYEVAPRSEETVRWLELRAPEGTSQKGMRDIITGIEAFIQNEMVSTPEKEGVGQWLSYLGHALPESDFREIDRLNQLPSRPDTAAFWITFSDPRQVNEQLQLLSHWIKQRYPELQFKNRLPWNRVDDREDSVLTLSGSTEAVLTDASWRVGQRLANQVGVASVWSEWGHYSKRLRLVVDTARSLRAGVTPREIYGLIASHLNGIELFRLADADRTEVVLSQGEHYSRRIDWLENLQVGTAKKGVQMPLSGMVAQQLTWEPSRLVRDGTGQRADFLLRLQPGVNKAQVIDELSALLEAESRYFGGELEYQLHFTDQSVRFVLWPVLPGMLIGLALMLIVMMVRYNAFGKGMMILLAPLPAGMGILLGNTLFSVAINPVALLGIGLVALWCWLVVIGFFECMSWVEGGRKSTHQMVCDGMACDGMEGVSVWLVPVLVSALTLISVCALLYVTGGTMWRPLALSLGSGVLVSAILLPFIVPALSGPLTTGRFFFDNASTNSQ
jgi:multidrug efflux pump subunit AcrB